MRATLLLAATTVVASAGFSWRSDGAMRSALTTLPCLANISARSGEHTPPARLRRQRACTLSSTTARAHAQPQHMRAHAHHPAHGRGLRGLETREFGKPTTAPESPPPPRATPALPDSMARKQTPREIQPNSTVPIRPISQILSNPSPLLPLLARLVAASAFDSWVRDLCEDGDVEPHPGPRFVSKTVNGVASGNKFSAIHAPSPVGRERAIIFNQWTATALGPPMACAFIRHAYGNMYHDFSLVDTQGRPFNWIFTFAKTLRRFRSAVNRYGEEIRRFHISRRYSALTEPDFHGPGSGRQRVDKVSEETRTQFAALLTISRDDHSFSLTQAFTNAIDTAERRETAARIRPAAAIPPPPARAAPPGGGGGAPGPP